MGYHEDADRNAGTLRDEISRLKNSDSFKDFWDQARNIRDHFKNLKPIRPVDRQELWSDFSSTCDTTKREQNAQREHRQRISQEKRSLIQEKLNEANGYISGARDGRDIGKARELLNKVNLLMKNGWETQNFQTQFVKEAFGNDGRLSKEDREYCWRESCSTWDQLNSKREQMQSFNFHKMEGLAYDAKSEAESGNPHDALKQIRAAQSNMKDTYMSREQYASVREILNNAFSRAISRIEEHKAERERKSQQWRSKQEAFRDKLEEALERKRTQVDNIHSQISRDEDILRDAKTYEFECTVQGWIDEKRDKINELERAISDIEAKLREVNDQLNSG